MASSSQVVFGARLPEAGRRDPRGQAWRAGGL